MSDTRKPVHLIASAIWGIVWISSFGVGLKSYVEFRQNGTIQWNGAQFRDRGQSLYLLHADLFQPLPLLAPFIN